MVQVIYMFALLSWSLCVKTLNDAIHISKDSGLTLGWVGGKAVSTVAVRRTGSVEALGDVRASQTHSLVLLSALLATGRRPVLLQHLTSRLGQLCGEEAAGGECAGSK